MPTGVYPRAPHPRAEIQCKRCDRSFTVIMSRAISASYCSEHCRRGTIPPIPCERCGQLFAVTRSRSQSAHFCSMDCQRAHWASLSETKTCEHCRRHFRITVKSSARDAGRFCSASCYHTSARGIPTKPPLPEATCGECGQRFSRSRRSRRAYCSNTCRSKGWESKRGPAHPLYTSVERACEMCGRVVAVKPALLSRFRFCSRRCAGSYVSTTWPRTSSIEIALRNELQRRGIDFAPEHPVGQYAVDIALPSYRVAIEADGDYWHSRPSQKPKDKRKDTYLQNLGWTVFRFWERDIKADVTACIDIVVDHLAVHAAAPETGTKRRVQFG
jgi:very-short-patch-repair endonuclease